MMNRGVTRFLLYLFRWQLSTPILAVFIGLFAYLGYWWAAALSNLIGACLFFWVDRWIFAVRGVGLEVSKNKNP